MENGLQSSICQPCSKALTKSPQDDERCQSGGIPGHRRQRSSRVCRPAPSAGGSRCPGDHGQVGNVVAYGLGGAVPSVRDGCRGDYEVVPSRQRTVISGWVLNRGTRAVLAYKPGPPVGIMCPGLWQSTGMVELPGLRQPVRNERPSTFGPTDRAYNSSRKRTYGGQTWPSR